MANCGFGRPVKWIEDEHETPDRRQPLRTSSTIACAPGRGRARSAPASAWQPLICHARRAPGRTHGLSVMGQQDRGRCSPAPAGSAPCECRPISAAHRRDLGHNLSRAPGLRKALRLRERIMDAIAAKLGIDRIELRRTQPHRRRRHALHHRIRRGEYRRAAVQFRRLSRPCSRRPSRSFRLGQDAAPRFSAAGAQQAKTQSAPASPCSWKKAAAGRPTARASPSTPAARSRW